MIKILKTGINVDKVIQQLKKYPGDWDHQKNLDRSQSLVDRGVCRLASQRTSTYNRWGQTQR